MSNSIHCFSCANSNGCNYYQIIFQIIMVIGLIIWDKKLTYEYYTTKKWNETELMIDKTCKSKIFTYLAQ